MNIDNKVAKINKVFLLCIPVPEYRRYLLYLFRPVMNFNVARRRLPTFARILSVGMFPELPCFLKSTVNAALYIMNVGVMEIPATKRGRTDVNSHLARSRILRPYICIKRKLLSLEKMRLFFIVHY